MPTPWRTSGRLARLAGVWEGCEATIVTRCSADAEQAVFLERYQLDPIDFQTNGPQLFYGLRYHTHIHEVGKVETFHDQVGYWLWEPATNTVVHTLTIPRGQVAGRGRLRGARCDEFEVAARWGLPSTASRRCRSSIVAFARRACVSGRRQPRWHVVVRRDFDARDARSRRALRAHRQQHPHEGRSTRPQSPCRRAVPR